MAKRRTNRNLNLDFRGGGSGNLPGTGYDWPDAKEFPLNLSSSQVRDIVLPDLRKSESPLLIAGYASLGSFIDFVAECDSCHQIRILFGHEPFPSTRKQYKSSRVSFDAEIMEYWSSQGISLKLSAKVIRAIEQIESEKIVAKKVAPNQRLHAKIYCGDDAVTIGSSNFTGYGLASQMEANARFERSKEAARFKDAKTIAENYWSRGEPFGNELVELLRQLLRVVDWREALARACAELLEGHWAKAYLDNDYFDEQNLWPSQRQGIAQALYILSTQGSVLIADATGSGKTKLGVHLIAAVNNEIHRSNRIRKGKPLLVCPPLVEDNWRNELSQSNLGMDVVSQGRLSRLHKDDRIVRSLRRAQILSVDEGHNFLNPGSNRTQQLLRNIADHVILFTATPINRGVRDLLHIADLLGADNLQESTVKAFQGILGFRVKDETLTEENLAAIRSEIQRFTVRRTKRDLNRLIDSNPDAYRSRHDTPCRFPKHVPKFYSLNEPQHDRELAEEIANLASQLTAVAQFQNDIKLSTKMRDLGWTEQTYLEQRLHSAKQLSKYAVMAALRSSRAALIEHISGTDKAIERFGVTGFSKSSSGAMIKKLYKCRGNLPKCHLLNVELPGWLADEDEHLEKCGDDISLYQKIRDLAMEMSDAREQSKVEQLLSLYRSHRLLLAFDSRPVTLAMLRQMIKEQDDDVDVVLATGDAKSDRDKFVRAFESDSSVERMIGLCSDSLSEGVNLQGASTVVHLDMPSVVRIAEQRVGRVDRLDSVHNEITAWWPDDAPAFRVSSDERFVERFATVESLLGANMPLPLREDNSGAKKVNPKEMVTEFEEVADTWDGIQDAFQPVRELIEGEEALISARQYKEAVDISYKVLCRVSLVKSHTEPWAFFCLSGGEYNAPRWLLFPSLSASVCTDLTEITSILRKRLDGDVQSLDLDDRAARLIDEFASRVSQYERISLPKKKRRALEELEILLQEFIDSESQARNQIHLEFLLELQSIFSKSEGDLVPDWDEVASRWLDVIRPTWFKRLDEPRRKPLLLKDIRNDLRADKDRVIEQLVKQFQSIPAASPPEERIQVCIIGING